MYIIICFILVGNNLFQAGSSSSFDLAKDNILVLESQIFPSSILSSYVFGGPESIHTSNCETFACTIFQEVVYLFEELNLHTFTKANYILLQLQISMNYISNKFLWYLWKISYFDQSHVTIIQNHFWIFYEFVCNGFFCK